MIELISSDRVLFIVRSIVFLHNDINGEMIRIKSGAAVCDLGIRNDFGIPVIINMDDFVFRFSKAFRCQFHADALAFCGLDLFAFIVEADIYGFDPGDRSLHRFIDHIRYGCVLNGSHLHFGAFREGSGFRRRFYRYAVCRTCEAQCFCGFCELLAFFSF